MENPFGFNYKKLTAYSGHYLNEEKIRSSSSGGAASAFSEAIIRQGGVVFGVKWSDNHRDAEYGRAEAVEDLAQFKGSKYIVKRREILLDGVYISVYKAVEAELKNHRPVLFIGLGCDVAGCSAYLKTKNADTTQLYLIDLICHGPTPAIALHSYLDEIEARYKTTVTDYSTRYKAENNKEVGWYPVYEKIDFVNRRSLCRDGSATDFSYAATLFVNHSCYQCPFKGDNHCADLTVGDFWGVDASMPQWNENRGVSLMLVKTDKGQTLMEMLTAVGFFTEPADIEFALRNNPNYYTRKKQWDGWETFRANLETKGLKYAVLADEGRLQYLRRTSPAYAFVRKMIPSGLKERIKKILHISASRMFR